MRAGKKKTGRRAVPSAAAAPPPPKQLLLDIDALALFSKLRLPVPSTVADVHALSQTVAAKKVDFLDKQRRVLAGETVEAEPAEAAARGRGTKAAPPKGTVVVGMRSDEVFGTVLLELMVA